MRKPKFTWYGKIILSMSMFAFFLVIAFISILLYTAPVSGSTPKVNTKSTEILMQQYEKQLSRDSCQVCMPDTSHMIFTKHGKFSVSGVIRVWTHPVPTYDGFKEYVQSFKLQHNK
jgi:hypothetical protein